MAENRFPVNHREGGRFATSLLPRSGGHPLTAIQTKTGIKTEGYPLRGWTRNVHLSFRWRILDNPCKLTFMLRNNPTTWTAPHWHADYADVAAEFDALRLLAIAVHDSIGNAKVLLEIPEPGLVYIRIDIIQDISAEVYSVPLTDGKGVGRRYAVFVFRGVNEESENYFESADAVLDFIRSYPAPCDE